MTKKQDFYELLGVFPTATNEEIKKAYKSLALKIHPDKSRKTSDQEFIRIHQAYTILSSPTTRKLYDSKISNQSNKLSIPIQENISIDNMDYNESDSSFSTSCRCGGLFIITENQLENDVCFVECDSCSSCIFVEYLVVSD